MHRVSQLLSASMVALAAWGCPANAPLHDPEASCADACVARAASSCDRAACERGCGFVLDRVMEREHLAVIDCVARGGTGSPADDAGADPWRDGPCADRAWATCAARIGIHADGGPPAPPPVDERPKD